MDEMITSRYEWTEDDLVNACVANHRFALRSPIVRSGRIFFIGLFLLGAVGWWMNRGWAAMRPETILPELAAPLVILAALVYLFYPKNILNLLWYRHYLRSIPASTRSIEWGFDPGQLWTRTELAESVFRWELFRTIVETPRCFLLFQGQQFSLWLPAHAFSSPGMLRMFTELARTRVPNYVVLGECRFPAKPESIGLDEF